MQVPLVQVAWRALRGSVFLNFSRKVFAKRWKELPKIHFDNSFLWSNRDKTVCPAAEQAVDLRAQAAVFIFFQTVMPQKTLRTLLGAL